MPDIEPETGPRIRPHNGSEHSPETLDELAVRIRACTLCQAHLPLGPRPVFQVRTEAKVLVVGQAPGTAVHKSGLPFDDPSGDRLRNWMGIDRDTFYDPTQLAIVPMGFCYPGRGKGGDLPPRPECAATWRHVLLRHLDNIELTIVLGRYAIDWHLDTARSSTLGAIVENWRSHWPHMVPLPHPSPRNTLWLRKHPWVEAEIVPSLQAKIRTLLSPGGQT
jgi:uracil-DNA glycosylase